MVGSYEVEDKEGVREERGDNDRWEERDLLESYDDLLRRVAYLSPLPLAPQSTPWTKRVFEVDEIREGDEIWSANVLQRRRKYKPVDQKVCPVPSYMPNSEGQTF